MIWVIIGTAVLIVALLIRSRPRRHAPLTITVSEGAPLPRPQFTADRPDLRTPEQRAADQAAFNQRGLPRGL